MLYKGYLITADGTTAKYPFYAMNCYDEVYAADTLLSNKK